jgi:hypothetical protein
MHASCTSHARDTLRIRSVLCAACAACATCVSCTACVACVVTVRGYSAWLQCVCNVRLVSGSHRPRSMGARHLCSYTRHETVGMAHGAWHIAHGAWHMAQWVCALRATSPLRHMHTYDLRSMHHASCIMHHASFIMHTYELLSMYHAHLCPIKHASCIIHHASCTPMPY